MRPSVDTIDMVRVVDYYNCITVIVSSDSELGEDFFSFLVPSSWVRPSFPRFYIYFVMNCSGRFKIAQERIRKTRLDPCCALHRLVYVGETRGRGDGLS